MVTVARPLAERVAGDRVGGRDSCVDPARRDDVWCGEQFRRFEELARVDETPAGCCSPAITTALPPVGVPWNAESACAVKME